MVWMVGAEFYWFTCITTEIPSWDKKILKPEISIWKCEMQWHEVLGQTL